jgi:hypothetical protein
MTPVSGGTSQALSSTALALAGLWLLLATGASGWVRPAPLWQQCQAAARLLPPAVGGGWQRPVADAAHPIMPLPLQSSGIADSQRRSG